MVAIMWQDLDILLWLCVESYPCSEHT